MNEQVLTPGVFKILRAYLRKSPLNWMILKMAGPVTLAMLGHTAVTLTDTAMVGSLGETALASVGLGGSVFWTLISFLLGGAGGVQIIASRRIGEKNFPGAGKVLLTSYYYALVGGLILCALGFAFAGPTMSLLTNDPVVLEQGASFMALRFLALPFAFLGFVVSSFFNGMGDTYLTMLSSMTTTILNIFLNWVLIYGNLGFQAYGVDGAAIASALASAIGFMVLIPFLFRKKMKPYWAFPPRPFNFKIIKEVMNVSFPPALEALLINIAFLLFYKFASIIGTRTVAATHIVITIMHISFMPGFAFGTAATTLVGQAMGAGKFHRGHQGAFRSAFFSALFMGLMGLLFIVFARDLLEIFAPRDPISRAAVIAEAMPALIIISLVQVGDAYHMVFASALRSAGRVFYVMLFYVLLSYLLLLPLAYFLGIVLGLKTTGLFISIFLWIFCLSIAFVKKFNTGDWKTVKI